MNQYTIQPGDSLTKIAQQHGTTVDALAKANNIANPNLITAGKTLVVPDVENISGNALVPPGGVPGSVNLSNTTPTGLSSIATTPAGGGTTTPPIKSTSTPPPTQTQTTPSSTGAGLPDNSFLNILNNLNQGFKSNNEYVKQKNAVVNAMLGQQVPPEQLATLPPEIRAIIAGGDRNQLMIQAQILNDQISGYGKGIASSIQYLTQGYQSSVTQAEKQKEDALNVLKEVYLETGDDTSLKNFIKTNYGFNTDENTADNIVNQVVSNTQPVDAAMKAIVGNESGGNYQAVSQPIKSGEFAGHQSYGKYQVLDVHIPDWTKEATGTVMTPQQFLADTKAQDAVAKMQIGKLWDKYGNIKDVASVWFTGKPASESGGLKDSTTGMTSEQYIQKATDAFNKIQDSISNNAGGTQYNQYGLLANTDFNPKNRTDQAAYNYLTTFLKTGKVPVPSQLGISTRSGVGLTQFSNITNRANDLFFTATGQSLPQPEVLKGNLDLVNANNKLINNLGVQESTIKKNFGLNLENLNANNINQSVPILNSIFNSIDTALGQPGTAQYNLQNATLQQEAGNLLAVKNASGTTVYDKMVGAGLIPKNASAEVQAKLMKTLLQEALNAKNSISEVNANLYSQIDPLEQDLNNPNRKGGDSSNDSNTKSNDPLGIR